MTPENVVRLLVILAVLCTVVGLRGVWFGQRIIRERGRDTLMHYPAPLPWLRQKVTAARWVVWIGRMYALAGLACAAGAWVLWTTPHGASPPIEENCSTLAQRVQRIQLEALQGGSMQTTLEAEGCRSSVMDAHGVRWFEIRSTPPDRLIGQGFNHSRGELERQGFVMTTIEGIGSRAALANPQQGSVLNPVLLFDDARGHHRIEMNTRKLKPGLQNRLIAGLQERSQPSQAQ